MLPLITGALVAPGARAAGSVAPPEGFADPAIKALWQRDDGSVASGAVSRPWMWGPGPFHTDYEPFSDGPLGNHLVQYFDKGRLEINDPSADQSSPWFVTSGLLVREMVSGYVQTGTNSFYKLGSASIPVAGDGGPLLDSGPTYAHFAQVMGAAPNRQGQPLPGNSYLRTNGPYAEVVGGMNFPVQVSLVRYEPVTSHNWADVFWSFANAPGRPAHFNWLTTLGYPITEPYWIIAPVAGVRQTLLVQLFERRVLTFNPANPSATQVEMGNVGRHYYTWRYRAPQSPDLRAKYIVSIAVGPAPKRLSSVQERVQVANTTDVPLYNLVLRAAWRHWDGVFTLQSASVDGNKADYRWRYGINLDVSLGKALPPGSTTTLDLAFDLKPRPVGGRTGYDVSNDILTLGDMLPTLATWEHGGWIYYPYSDLGDLGYYSSADYSVVIASTGSERLVVGGTGKIVSVSQDGTAWRFNATNVRDVGYVISPRFINPLSDASMTRQAGGVKILGYFQPGQRQGGQTQLDLVAPAIAWFSSNIGQYPFDTYMIGEMGVPLDPTDNYAQEYPMDYLIPAQWLSYGITPGGWTWYTPVHEAGHQWFYSTVGSNQLTDPWLDEAMTTYITTEYVRANFPSLYSRSYASMTANAQSSRPVSSSVYSGFNSEQQYTNTVYDTGVVMLNRVRLSMGDTAFYEALRDYYATYRFKRARTLDLVTTLQRHSKADLTSIFAQYLDY